MILSAIRSSIRICILFILIQGLNYTQLVRKYTPQPNPYARFGGQFRQAAFCIQLLLLVNFILLCAEEFLKREKLKKLSGLLFVNLTRPICLVYSSFVWINTLLVLNPIIHWTSSDRWCPRWYGHTIYSLPAISVLLESFISSHETHGYWKPVRYSIYSYVTFGLWHISLWFLDDRLPNKLFDQSALKQFLFALSIFLLILSWVGIGYLIDWVLFDLPSDNEMQPKIDQNRMATKCEEVQPELKPEISPSFESSESENTSDGNNSNESDGNSDVDDSSDKIECISSNNSSNPASSETKKDD